MMVTLTRRRRRMARRNFRSAKESPNPMEIASKGTVESISTVSQPGGHLGLGRAEVGELIKQLLLKIRYMEMR